MSVTTSVATLVARGALGGYLAVHGAQKLFGAFGGPGLDGAAKGFERMGLSPGRPMATLAGASELGGGVLTATGIAHPLGPIALSGSMVVAAAVHRQQGPMAAKGGFELPVTNLALAILLAATGPGPLRLGPRLSGGKAAVTALGAAACTAFALKQLLGQPQPAAGSAAPATPNGDE